MSKVARWWRVSRSLILSNFGLRIPIDVVAVSVHTEFPRLRKRRSHSNQINAKQRVFCKIKTWPKSYEISYSIRSKKRKKKLTSSSITIPLKIANKWRGH